MKLAIPLRRRECVSRKGQTPSNRGTQSHGSGSASRTASCREETTMARSTRIAGDSPPRTALRSTRTIHGFTLVETLCAIVIVGIAAAIATPKIDDMARSLRIEGSAQAFVGDLNRAHSEAIKRNAAVSVVLAGAQTYRIT